MKKLIIAACVALTLAACSKEENTIPAFDGQVEYGEFIDDRDGTVYNTIKIGNQEWMTENLKYRMPQGSLDGCYTFGENTINLTQLVIDKPLFRDSINKAIERGEIVNPDGIPAAQRPTTVISLNFNLLTPRQLMDRLVAFPDVVAVLDRIHTKLLAPAAKIQAATNFAAAEKENDTYAEKYGLLYTYQAAQKVAPEGWRVPTDEDWQMLEKKLGIPDSEVDKLNAWRGEVASRFLAGFKDHVGFNAKLGGGRLYGSFMYGTPFTNKQVNGYYWSSSIIHDTDSTTLAINRNFMRSENGIWRGTSKKEAAYHIKCVRNN
jgi:uncharacterized protein (TIGR02145 family)